MGASAREIEQEIKETRDRMDENLTVLERRAASNAVRVGKILAVATGLAVGAVGGIFVYRRLRRRTLKDRQKAVSPPPTVKVTVNEKGDERGTVETILRKVVPALVATASTALLERIVRPRARTRP
jgi:hypothetical protein